MWSCSSLLPADSTDTFPGVLVSGAGVFPLAGWQRCLCWNRDGTSPQGDTAPLLSLREPGLKGGLSAVMAIGMHGRDKAAELIKAIS